MYVFADSSLAEKLRERGFSVIQTNNGSKAKFAVLESPELEKLMLGEYSEFKFAKTDLLCF